VLNTHPVPTADIDMRKQARTRLPAGTCAAFGYRSPNWQMSRRTRNATAKRGILSALAAVAVLAVAGSATAAESYNIETILPLTGPNSFVGNEEREAFGVLEPRLIEAAVSTGARSISRSSIRNRARSSRCNSRPSCCRRIRQC